MGTVKMKRMTDLATVAYLNVMGIHPIKEEKEGKFVSFFFEDTPELEKAINTYLDHKAFIDVLAFFERYRTLRSMVVEKRRH